MKFIRHLEGLFTNRATLAKDILALFKLEAKLAAMNAPGLVINLSLLVVFLLTLWLGLMVFLAFYIYGLTKQPLIAIGSDLVINLILIVFLLINIKSRIKQMSFARTRDCLGTTQEGSEK